MRVSATALTSVSGGSEGRGAGQRAEDASSGQTLRTPSTSFNMHNSRQRSPDTGSMWSQQDAPSPSVRRCVWRARKGGGGGGGGWVQGGGRRRRSSP